MSRITIIDHTNANAEQKALFDAIKSQLGMVPNFLKVFANSPVALKAFLGLLKPRLTSSSNDGALAAAVEGFGLTRLLSYQIADHLQSGQLEVVLQDCEPSALPVHLVHREGRHASRKARAFLDLAVARLRANPALY